jgi:hypothetical protein
VPGRIATSLAGENDVYYVLKQTHEPLLRKDDGQNYSSRILRSWGRNIRSSEYTFCPDTRLSFAGGERFTVFFLEKYLRIVTGRFSSDFLVSSDSGCVKVGFRKSRGRFLEFLSLYENAPTVKISDKYEAGLGRFDVERMAEDKIVLKRKEHASNGYDRIVVRSYLGPSDPALEDRKVADFNRIPVGDIPAWVKQSFVKFDSVILKSTVLIINDPDEAVRARIYNCMDIPGLRSALFPTRKDFRDIQNVLPVGVPGALPGPPPQDCRGVLRTGPAPAGHGLIFVNWRKESHEALKKVLAGVNRKSGLDTRLKDVSPDLLTPLLFRRPHPFNLLVIAFDAVRSDQSAFFDYLLRKDGYLDFDMPEVVAKYETMLRSENEDEANVLAGEVARDISRRRVALPLYQEVRGFYYPENISNLLVGKGFLEYPEVADLRW